MSDEGAVLADVGVESVEGFSVTVDGKSGAHQTHLRLLALGIVPTTILTWVDSWPHGVGPWAAPRLGGAAPQLLTGPEIDLGAVAAARSANPGFAGKTVCVATASGGRYQAYIRRDDRVQLIEALGFTNSPTIERTEPDTYGPGRYFTTLTREDSAWLDADLTAMLDVDAIAMLKQIDLVAPQELVLLFLQENGLTPQGAEAITASLATRGRRGRELWDGRAEIPSRGRGLRAQQQTLTAWFHQSASVN